MCMCIPREFYSQHCVYDLGARERRQQQFCLDLIIVNSEFTELVGFEVTIAIPV